MALVSLLQQLSLPLQPLSLSSQVTHIPAGAHTERGCKYTLFLLGLGWQLGRAPMCPHIFKSPMGTKMSPADTSGSLTQARKPDPASLLPFLPFL